MSTNRSLRTTVNDELYQAIEAYARATNMSTAKCAAFLLAAGVAFVEALAEQEERRSDQR